MSLELWDSSSDQGTMSPSPSAQSIMNTWVKRSQRVSKPPSMGAYMHTSENSKCTAIWLLFWLILRTSLFTWSLTFITSSVDYPLPVFTFFTFSYMFLWCKWLTLDTFVQYAAYSINHIRSTHRTAVVIAVVAIVIMRRTDTTDCQNIRG